MRVLLLFRGAPGCGKSTFIEEHGLKPYTLCADDIRLMCASPTLQTDGTRKISQENDKTVWNTLFKILEIRMQNGEFTVIDATNSKTAEMTRYKDLAQNYRYRIYCIDMTNIPAEEVKRRNQNRELIKQVPEEVIDKMYSRFDSQQIPTGIKVLKPEELDTIWYTAVDFSSYQKIHVFGDIHGCHTVLKEYLDSVGGFREDNLYIFTGDYVDRGIENVETINLLCDQCTYKNVICLEGNHERWLWMYANDIVTQSKEFEFITKPQLNKANVSKKKIREFYRRLGQCCYFTYYNKTFFISHGGVSNIPENLLMIPTEQMIKGVGRYSESNEADQSFEKYTNPNVYQVHGHRNVTDSPIQTTSRTYNLEGSVELGGHLRVLQITENGITPIEIKNTVFKSPEEREEEDHVAEDVDMSVYNLVSEMRNNRNIYEKKFGRVSSFNFTREAFENKAWDSIVNKARGLYIDNKEYKVIARSYEKFFNINERPETQLNNLRYKLQFPVTAYVKENGFLGIVGWNPETEDLLITSKSSPIGNFSEYLKNALYSKYGEETMAKIRDYIKEYNVSFVFECCDMENDPHIIEYPETKVVLLDVIKNQLKYEKLSYSELQELAKEFGIIVKTKAYTIESWEDFLPWYNEVTAEDYQYNGEYIEGFVIEDNIGYMTKLKLHYYKLWKKLRCVACSVLKTGNYKYMGSLMTPMENEFFGWCKNLYTSMSSEERKDLAEKCYTNICDLRTLFQTETHLIEI